MSSDTRTRASIDRNDPVFQYIVSSPPPAASISDDNVQIALRQLEEAAEVAIRDDAGKRWVPGLAIVVVGRKNQVLHCDGYGTKRVDGSAKIGPDTLFPCASLSKPVSATLLAHAGLPRKLAPGNTPEVQGWDQSVGYTLVHASDKTKTLGTTLRQWLSHRSGLPDHAGDLIEDLNPSIPQEVLINSVLDNQTGIKPGTFSYTNFGFTMGCLGGMKALGSGTSWDETSSRWLNELGMSRSTFAFTHADQDSQADRAFPHVGQPDPPTELLEVDPTGWTWRVAGRDQERDPTLQAPAGGLVSCARDLGQFLIKHLGTGFTAFPPKDPPAEDLEDGHRYSLGWNVRNPGQDDVSFSHSGAFRLGAGTCLRFDPLSGFGVAVLSNGEPTGVPEALVTLFFNQLYGRQLPPGSDYARLFATFRPLMMNEMYTTKIDNYNRYNGRRSERVPGSIPHGKVFEGYSPYYASKIVIERKGADDVVLKLGNAGNGSPLWEFPLRCIDAATLTFVYDTRGENEVGPSAIRLVQENATVVKVIDDWLNGSGPGLGEIAARY
jgi:CubicO group peptidase (beta-lactamase class C family)